MNGFSTAVLLAASILSMSTGLAAVAQVEPSPPASSQARPVINNAASSNSATKVKSNSATKVKLIDINHATAAELKTLPGIGDAESAKIIAQRPFGSKAWLVSHGVLPESKFADISSLIVAKQPFKDAAKNTELYKNKESK